MANLPTNINYYYLDGLDKKGPYNSEEIKARNLNIETLIFKDGASNWSPLSNFPELLQPVILQENNDAANSADISKDNEVTKTKIRIPVFLVITLGVSICIGSSYAIVHFERLHDLQSFKNEIDNLFKGKTAISDYSYTTTSGEIYKVFLSGFLGLKSEEKNIVKTEKHTLSYKPFLKEGAKDYEVQQYNKELKEWNDFKELVEYYEADKYTGFTALRLEKYYDKYTIEDFWSGDMAYKVSEYKHYPGYNSNYYSSPGYDLPTNRPSVSEAYKEAVKFLTVENEDKSYEAGSFSTISAFPHKESNFYEIEQDYPRYSYYSDTIFVEWRPNEQRGHQINYGKISRNTSRKDASVFNGYWIVWYKSYKNKYSIKERDSVFTKKVSLYSIALSIGFISLFYIFRYWKRIQIQ
jgi:hypothetical protein